MCFNFFLAKAKRFYLIQKLRNYTKTFWFSLQISKTKQNFLQSQKKIWKRNISISFGPKILRTERERFESTMNFVSKTNILDFFWNVSRKTEANDLEITLVLHYYAGGVLAVKAKHNCTRCVYVSGARPPPPPPPQPLSSPPLPPPLPPTPSHRRCACCEG